MKRSKEPKFHPACEIFPRMEGEEFEAFKRDILDHGQQEPAIELDGLIIDGRNRALACYELGIPLKTVPYKGDKSIADFVWSTNFHRRHLGSGAKAACGVEYERLKAAEAKERQREGGRSFGRGKSVVSDDDSNAPRQKRKLRPQARDEAAKAVGTNHRYIQDAKLVANHSPKLLEDVKRERLTLPQATQQVRRELRQRELVKQAKTIKAAPPAAADAPADWEVVEGDNISELKKRPDESVRLVFVDPPYNNGFTYDSDPTGDQLSDEAYLAWCKAWMTQCARVLDPAGSMFVLIDDAWSDHFGVMLRSIGLHRRNTIIWWEHFPNHTNGNFSKAARFIHYYTKSPTGFVWNDMDIRVASQRMVLDDKRANPAGKVPNNVWQITRKVGNATDRVPFEDAPPQIPDELVERVVLAASNPGDLVLDCFSGNGTTGRAALRHGRRYLGIERSHKYAVQSRLWIPAVLTAGEARRSA